MEEFFICSSLVGSDERDYCFCGVGVRKLLAYILVESLDIPFERLERQFVKALLDSEC